MTKNAMGFVVAAMVLGCAGTAQAEDLLDRGDECDKHSDCKSGRCGNGGCSTGCKKVCLAPRKLAADDDGASKQKCRTGECDVGANCSHNNQCKPGLICRGGRCDHPCTSGTQCGEGALCSHDTDCQKPLICRDGRCSQPPPANCFDHNKNGSETDTDCGNGCEKCWDFANCLIPTDCKSGVCGLSKCQPATCADKVKNGGPQGETDVDCGGWDNCPQCDNGKVCRTNHDCKSNNCVEGVCKAEPEKKPREHWLTLQTTFLVWGAPVASGVVLPTFNNGGHDRLYGAVVFNICMGWTYNNGEFLAQVLPCIGPGSASTAPNSGFTFGLEGRVAWWLKKVWVGVTVPFRGNYVGGPNNGLGTWGIFLEPTLLAPLAGRYLMFLFSIGPGYCYDPRGSPPGGRPHLFCGGGQVGLQTQF